MDGTVITQLAERFARPTEIAGNIWAPQGWTGNDPAALVKPGPTADPLAVYSLGAVRDYLASNRDTLDLTHTVVHVVSPQLVKVLGPLQTRARNREVYLQAQAQNLTDNFLGKCVAHEEFVIGLQTRFADSEDRRAVLKLIGNIKHEQVKTSADDGITQTVQAKAGIVLSHEVAVPNPIKLVPYRTFREVTQPESLFVLRVTAGRAGGLPDVGLFEADGGAWRLTAVDRVRDWLVEALPAPSCAVLA